MGFIVHFNPLSPTRMRRNQLRGYESSRQKMAILCVVDSLRYICEGTFQLSLTRLGSIYTIELVACGI